VVRDEGSSTEPKENSGEPSAPSLHESARVGDYVRGSDRSMIDDSERPHDREQGGRRSATRDLPRGERPKGRLARWLSPGGLRRDLLLILLAAAVTYYAPGLLRQAARPVSPSPLAVEVLSDPGQYTGDSAYDPWWLLPDNTVTPEQIPSGVDAVNGGVYGFWARNHGGVPAHHRLIRLIVRARGDDVVVVNGLRILVHDRRDPLAGWYVRSGACGPGEVRKANIDLDQQPPRVEFYERDDASPKRSLTLKVSRDDIEIIDIEAITTRFDVTWSAELLYEVGGETNSVRVDDHGQPFRVSAVAKGRTYVDSYEAGKVTLKRDPEQDGEYGIC
jgi:hypothetical protein